MNYISMDIGTSNIKIIEVDETLNIKNRMILEKMIPEEALGKFINENNINLDNIEKIVVTGVGANNMEDRFLNKEIVKVPEFIATGCIGEEQKFIVASVGTGTAFIKNENGDITHLGGTGVGGGTLINLCKKINPQVSFEDIRSAELTGNLKNVDLTIQDVTTEEIKTLPKDITAVNFGKLNDKIFYFVTNPRNLEEKAIVFFKIDGKKLIEIEKININDIDYKYEDNSSFNSQSYS